MNHPTVDYVQEFDKLVMKYNERLASLENPKVQKRNKWRAFFNGMGSVLEIFGNPFDTKTFEYSHQLYSKDNLTPEQKDAIELASVWQKVDKKLDNIISGNLSNENISVENAKAGKLLVQQKYNHFMDVYVSHAMR